MRSRFADHWVEEFRNAHARGVRGEVDVLRDFFGDPRIRLQDGGLGTVFPSRCSTRDGSILCANDYKALLELQGSPRVGPAP